MTALHSQRYLAGSRDEDCKLRIPGVCDNRNVVPCHARDRHTGGAQKASDLSVIDGCGACHDVFDRRAKLPNGQHLSEADWLFYALRGLQDTLEARRAKGLLFVPEDVPKPFAARKKPGKKGRSRAIPQRVKTPAPPQRSATRKTEKWSAL